MTDNIRSMAERASSARHRSAGGGSASITEEIAAREIKKTADAIERVARQAVEAEREAFVKQGMNKAVAILENYDFQSSDYAVETSIKHAKRMMIRTIQQELKKP